jgi:hypothetical protein
VGGAALRVLELLWSISGGENPWGTAHAIAGIAFGPDVAAASDFSVRIIASALLIHYGLGMLFGCVLAVVLSAWRMGDTPGTALTLGALFGIALYVLNFYVMTAPFPWFVAMRTLETFIGHVLFGTVTALIYWKLKQS